MFLRHSTLEDFWTPMMVYQLTCSLLWISSIWHAWLNFRQYLVLATNVIPPVQLRSMLDTVYFERARAYRFDLARVALIQTIVSHLSTIAILHWELGPKLWDVCQLCVDYTEYKGDREYPVSAVFVFVVMTLSNVLSLPWDIYTSLCLDAKHEISRHTEPISCYLRRRAISMFLTQVAQVFMLLGAVYIVKQLGPISWLLYWILRCTLNILYEAFYMTYFAPYFQNVYRLPYSELRVAIEELAASIGFPLAELYVFEVSSYTTISNAHIAGALYEKYVILFDTLFADELVPHGDSTSEWENSSSMYMPMDNGRLSEGAPYRPRSLVMRRRFPDEEVLAIVCHEMGHWKMWHVVKLFILTELERALNYSLAAYLYQNPTIFRAFGFPFCMPTLIGILLTTSIILAPLNIIAAFLKTCYKRKCETDADKFVYSMQQGPYMERAVITMNMDSLNFPLSDPLYSWWFDSHPPLPRRIEILRGDFGGRSGLSRCHLTAGRTLPPSSYPRRMLHERSYDWT